MNLLLLEIIPFQHSFNINLKEQKFSDYQHGEESYYGLLGYDTV
jgi:hypothetical protein